MFIYQILTLQVLPKRTGRYRVSVRGPACDYLNPVPLTLTPGIIQSMRHVLGLNDRGEGAGTSRTGQPPVGARIQQINTAVGARGGTGAVSTISHA